MFNDSRDEKFANKPILYLPKCSYFGDWQILHSLRSNLVFKTMGVKPKESASAALLGKLLDVVGDVQDVLEQAKEKTVLFMCVEKDVLLEQCELFPQTAENIKKRSLFRRNQYMVQREVNYSKASAKKTP